jgi:hypothetical protein
MSLGKITSNLTCAFWAPPWLLQNILGDLGVVLGAAVASPESQSFLQDHNQTLNRF